MFEWKHRLVPLRREASAQRTARKQLSIFPLKAFTASDGASAEFQSYWSRERREDGNSEKGGIVIKCDVGGFRACQEGSTQNNHVISPQSF